MPKFYFHLHNDFDVRDDEGQEFPDLDAAREWARDQARQLFAQIVKDDGRVALHHHIDIENERGEVLDSLTFTDVVTIER